MFKCRAQCAGSLIAAVFLLVCAPASATPVPASARGAGETDRTLNVAFGAADLSRAATHGVRQVQGRFQRSDFMEDTPEEIARENRRNPWQAWALAFFPTALVKGVTLGLAFAKADTEQWAVFMPIIPTMGISHFWETKVYWAGLVALAGDIIGSSLLTYYFSQLYESTPLNPPPNTMMLAGVAVLAVFFLFENISAPLLANSENKKLQRQFMPAGSQADLGPSWRSSPWPDRGVAQLGPSLNQPIPVTTGYAFKF